MKVRTDFVSNSSSSSFIIGEFKNSFISYFNLSKADFLEAIADLWPKNVPLKDGSTFYVLDKASPTDLNVIKSGKTDYLKYWTNTIMCRKAGRWAHVFSFKRYECAYDALCEIYYLPYTYDFNGKNYCYIYDPKTEKTVEKPVPKFVDRVVRDLRSFYGIVDNHETLMDDTARFLLHFDDNEIWKLTGMSDPGRNEYMSEQYKEKIRNSKWETDAQSLQRVCEVFFNWFKTHGKLNATFDTKPDLLTWRALYSDVMAATLHEG